MTENAWRRHRTEGDAHPVPPAALRFACITGWAVLLRRSPNQSDGDAGRTRPCACMSAIFTVICRPGLWPATARFQGLVKNGSAAGQSP